MTLLNIDFFGFEFPDTISWQLLPFVSEQWIFAAALAAVALVVMALQIVLAVQSHRKGGAVLGRVMTAVYSLSLALFCLGESGLCEKYLSLDASVLTVINTALYMVSLILFAGMLLYGFFGERPVIGHVLMIVMTVYAAAAFALDALDLMALELNALGLSLFLLLLLVVLIVVSLVRLCLTGRGAYVVFMITTILFLCAIAFEFFNEKEAFLADVSYDYRLVLDAYLVIMTVIGFILNAKAEPSARGLEGEGADKRAAVKKAETPEFKPVTVEVTSIEDVEDEELLGENVPEETAAPDMTAEAEEPTEPEETETPAVTQETAPEEKKAEFIPLANAIRANEVAKKVAEANEVQVAEYVEQAQTEPVQTEPARKEPSYSPHYTDFLTNVRNRLYFMEQIRETESSKDYENNVAVAVFDVDHLATVNEAEGYEAGDQMLKLAATAIERSFADMGDCARIDGDEFAILMKDTKPGMISQRLLVLLEAVRKYNERAGAKLSVSFGYAVYSGTEGLSVEALIRMAEKRMQEKKAAEQKQMPEESK